MLHLPWKARGRFGIGFYLQPTRMIRACHQKGNDPHFEALWPDHHRFADMKLRERLVHLLAVILSINDAAF